MFYMIMTAFLAVSFIWILLTLLLILNSIFRVLEYISLALKPQPPKSSAVAVSILLDGKRGSKMQVLDSGSVTASLELDDAKGLAVPGAALDASPAPVWGLDDASFGSLAPSADGLSCVFTPAAKLGICHLQFSGSLGGQAVTAISEDINVVPGAAVSVKMSLV